MAWYASSPPCRPRRLPLPLLGGNDLVDLVVVIGDVGREFVLVELVGIGLRLLLFGLLFLYELGVDVVVGRGVVIVRRWHRGGA